MAEDNMNDTEEPANEKTARDKESQMCSMLIMYIQEQQMIMTVGCQWMGPQYFMKLTPEIYNIY